MVPANSQILSWPSCRTCGVNFRFADIHFTARSTAQSDSIWVSRWLLLLVASGQATMPSVNSHDFKPFPVRTFSALFSRLFLDNDIFYQRLESLTVWLDDRDGKMAGFAGVDVSYRAAFTFVCAADDFAFGTIFQLAWLSGFHASSLFGMDCRLRPIFIRIAQLSMIERPNELRSARLAISRRIDREF